jgi:hypothetical protein
MFSPRITSPRLSMVNDGGVGVGGARGAGLVDNINLLGSLPRSPLDILP